MEKRRQELTGKVVSAKNDKTITVLVETYVNDSKYHKRVKYSKKYIAGVGDTVLIAETRPLSKTKHYRLVKVVEKAIIL